MLFAIAEIQRSKSRIWLTSVVCHCRDPEVKIQELTSVVCHCRDPEVKLQELTSVVYHYRDPEVKIQELVLFAIAEIQR